MSADIGLVLLGFGLGGAASLGAIAYVLRVAFRNPQMRIPR